MNDQKQSQGGFLIIKIILIVAIMIMGYVVISNAQQSEQGQDAIETVNEARDKADQIIN